MARLFVAVWPPEDVLDRVAALNRPAVAGLRWTTRDQWHVTLRFLGEVPEVEPVRTALGDVSALPVVAATLGPAVDRFGRRVLHIPVAGLDGLAARVMDATGHLGRAPEDRPFVGHVTLARVARNAKVDLRPLAGAGVTGTWTVRDVCLVESRLSRAGARYAVLDTVPLTGAPDSG